MTRHKQLILAGFALVNLLLVLVLFEASGFDMWLQKFFYDHDAHMWLVSREDGLGDWAFYTGPKSVIIAIGTILTLVAFGSFASERLTPYRKALWLTVAVMALIPAGVSLAKATTHIHCPRQLKEFGGDAVYNPAIQKLTGHIAEQEAGLKPGRCFPAGHASGGFALLAFALLVQPSRRKIVYGIALFTGWWMGAYQMLNGAHFLSHTFVTMFWALFVMRIGLYFVEKYHTPKLKI